MQRHSWFRKSWRYKFRGRGSVQKCRCYQSSSFGCSLLSTAMFWVSGFVSHKMSSFTLKIMTLHKTSEGPRCNPRDGSLPSLHAGIKTSILVPSYSNALSCLSNWHIVHCIHLEKNARTGNIHGAWSILT